MLWKVNLMHLLHQPSMVHEVKYFDKVERTHTMGLYVPKYKVVLFATLILTWDKFNDVVERMASMFLVLPKVIQNLVQVSDARSCIPQHFKTQDRVFSDQGTMMQDVHILILMMQDSGGKIVIKEEKKINWTNPKLYHLESAWQP